MRGEIELQAHGEGLKMPVEEISMHAMGDRSVPFPDFKAEE